jgi:hypothetical protein
MTKQEPSKKLDNQVVGNVGMYYVCYKLSLLGWNVMPTTRNARGIDIVAYNKTGEDFKGLQVKTLSKRNPVPLGDDENKIIGDFWIIVNNIMSEINVYVMTPAEIKKVAQKSTKDKNGNAKTSYWLQTKDYETEEFKDKWDRIGRGDD